MLMDFWRKHQQKHMGIWFGVKSNRIVKLKIKSNQTKSTLKNYTPTSDVKGNWWKRNETKQRWKMQGEIKTMAKGDIQRY